MFSLETLVTSNDEGPYNSQDLFRGLAYEAYHIRYKQAEDSSERIKHRCRRCPRNADSIRVLFGFSLRAKPLQTAPSLVEE